jgi:hypothetical protein
MEPCPICSETSKSLAEPHPSHPYVEIRRCPTCGNVVAYLQKFTVPEISDRDEKPRFLENVPTRKYERDNNIWEVAANLTSR